MPPVTDPKRESDAGTPGDVSPPDARVEASPSSALRGTAEAQDGNAVATLLVALKQIVDMAERSYGGFPSDWSAQIKACAECQRYANHPIQRGICDEHRRPLWERERHESFEALALGPRMREIAREALRRFYK